MDELPVDQPTFEDSYVMAAPVDEVWTFLTEPEAINLWHFSSAMTFDPRPGGVVRYGSGQEAVIEGTITEFEPNRRLAHTFRFTSEPDDPPSEVSFSLEPFPSGCRLTIRHTGLPPDRASYRDICACWPVLMCGLQNILKARKPARARRSA